MHLQPPRAFSSLTGLVLVAAFVTAGCAQLPPPPESAASDQRVTRLKSDPPGIVIFRGWGAAAAAPGGEANSPNAGPSPAPPASAPLAARSTAAQPAADTGGPAAAVPSGAKAVHANSPALATPTPTPTAQAAPAPADSPLTRLLRALPPPTGQPVQEIRQLNAPGLGIAVPTAASRASEPKR